MTTSENYSLSTIVEKARQIQAQNAWMDTIEAITARYSSKWDIRKDKIEREYYKSVLHEDIDHALVKIALGDGREGVETLVRKVAELKYLLEKL